jgi:hypothetical protein
MEVFKSSGSAYWYVMERKVIVAECVCKMYSFRLKLRGPSRCVYDEYINIYYHQNTTINYLMTIIRQHVLTLWGSSSGLYKELKTI